MKRIILSLVLPALTIFSVMAMSDSRLRQNARFLSDRMAYELDLSPMQYDDCYEINYDFLYAINPFMDDVALGYYDAIDRYYEYLDYRNDDIRYVLSPAQYARFISLEYFFRPLYTSGRTWALRVHRVYTNRSFFYFDVPTGYRSYTGIHARRHYATGYYVTRYRHQPRHATPVYIRSGKAFRDNRRHDFGANLRQRNEDRSNNYRNERQNNRTLDSRYRDNSGNRNSPAINSRQQNSSNRSSQNSGRAQQQQQSRARQQSQGWTQQSSQSRTRSTNRSSSSTENNATNSGSSRVGRR